jgi:hypothetical protein
MCEIRVLPAEACWSSRHQKSRPRKANVTKGYWEDKVNLWLAHKCMFYELLKFAFSHPRNPPFDLNAVMMKSAGRMGSMRNTLLEEIENDIDSCPCFSIGCIC